MGRFAELDLIFLFKLHIQTPARGMQLEIVHNPSRSGMHQIDKGNNRIN